jgi:cyclopropane fatty-acyl-phospholipid synthase-like methyltransferase
MSADYLLIRSALPDFIELQRLVSDAVAGHATHCPGARLRILDLGCGDGVTSHTILSQCPDVQITALDNEESMVGQATENLVDAIRAGRCQVILQDALTFLRGQPECTFDVVASALALHNLARDHRHAVHEAIFRALKPGGRFINADRYTVNEEQRFQRLHCILERFFDLFVPLGKMDLLRASVLHEIADEAPERLMREDDTLRELAAIGFGNVSIQGRLLMASLLVASRPG